MEQRWLAFCALILALSAFVHPGTAAVRKGRDVIDKPGMCPPIYKGQFGVCVELCLDDSSCPNDEKCCSNGCGHVCTAPYKVKPGVCPAPQGISLCAFLCNHDGQCPGEQKCCRTSCGKDCREPLKI